MLDRIPRKTSVMQLFIWKAVSMKRKINLSSQCLRMVSSEFGISQEGVFNLLHFILSKLLQVSIYVREFGKDLKIVIVLFSYVLLSNKNITFNRLKVENELKVLKDSLK